MDVITFPVILLHGVIALPDATSYDKVIYAQVVNHDSSIDTVASLTTKQNAAVTSVMDQLAPTSSELTL